MINVYQLKSQNSKISNYEISNIDNSKIELDSTKLKKNNFWEYGFSLGFPAIFNLNLGYNYKKLKFRFSIGSSSVPVSGYPINGYQILLSYQLYKNENTNIYFSLPIGLTYIDADEILKDKYIYRGLAFHVNSKNWEIGLGYVFSNYYRGNDYNDFRDRQMPYIHIGYIIQSTN